MAIDRRQFIRLSGTAAAGIAAAAAWADAPSDRSDTTDPGPRKFKISLRAFSIGVNVDQRRQLELAAAHGFEACNANASFLAGLSAAELDELRGEMADRAIVWGASGLPVEFRKDQATFESGLKALPELAAGLRRAGVTRVDTYLMPSSDELTYTQNFRQHADRLRRCVDVLGDHGLRFGMEYVGPKTLWAAKKYPFLHTLAETRDLIAAIDRPGVGVVLDSWHWYTAGESVADLLTLTNQDVVSCDLNDAPLGRQVDEQIDNQRELPMATGVIDTAGFINALIRIGYDGPIRAEPFNQTLDAMDDEAAVAATAAAMKLAVATAR